MNISFPKRNTKLEEQKMSDEPRAYAPPAQRPRQPYAEQAAQAAQHVINLEAEVERLTKDNAYLNSQITVLEERLRLALDEKAQIEKHNDAMVRENTAVFTRLSIVTNLLLELKKPIGGSKLDSDAAVSLAEQIAMVAIENTTEEKQG